jgi:mRNA-degrading endonuclease toxin of MazEF toxin-antitoxin module
MQTPQGTDTKRVPIRRGKKAVAFWVDAEASIELKVAAAVTSRSIQSIMEEALADWFRKHRRTQKTNVR